MPYCPLEWDASKPATWKEWRPRIEKDGKSYQSELRTITGTRKELMERVKAIYSDADPHQWKDSWLTQMRHLLYATGEADELFISTDFSAQFDHKCAWTLTCEHPPRSNQAVYVVTRTYLDSNGVRKFDTDVWRIFSEVKGDALFHNTALSLIVEYYKAECEACEADEGCEEGKTEVESEPEEPEEVEPEEAEVERLEAASDSEAEEDGAGDLVFEFDENGGRIRPEEEAAHMAEEEAEMETRGAVVEQPSASRRRSRQVEILQQAAGQEHTTQGETRTEQQGQRAQGIFTAQKYFWMYFAPGPNSGLQIVKPGERAGPGQCHAILDAAANLDADSVTASNETYEYAGIDASQPEMLYTKTFTCAASCCRDRSSISLDSRACPFLAFTGRWQQQTVHAMHGVTRVAAEKRVAAS
eukprot:jgi/Chrpa1/25249/Chrysochromulina_OHIO_Genome00026692-RA